MGRGPGARRVWGQQTRRVVHLAWALVGLPLALLGAVTVSSAQRENWLHEAATVNLPAGIQAVAVGSDRTGDQLVLLEVGGRLHDLRQALRRQPARPLTVPWTGEALRRLSTCFRDVDGDERLELLVFSLSSFNREDPRRFGQTYPCAVYAVTDAGLKLSEASERGLVRRSGNDPSVIYAGGRALGITCHQTELTRKTITTLIRQTDQHPVFALNGQATAVADVDGDGHQDLFTAEAGEAVNEFRFRLYAFRDERFQLVWDQFWQAQVSRELHVPLVLTADLNDDGLREVITLDPDGGRATIWLVDETAVF